MPRVTVLITTHGSPHLGDAVRSVLAQDMPDFELLVVDDAGTDGGAASLAGLDARLRVLRAPARLGIAGARNLGLAAARAPLVAALDHDDLCRPDRLRRQAAAMEADGRLVLCGSAMRVLGGRGVARIGHAGAAGPALARWMLHLGTPFAWSSVMLRLEAVRRLGVPLRAEREPADDLDLHHRLLRLGEAVRLPEPLVTYRWHAGNTSHARRAALTAAAGRVLAEACAALLGEAPAGADAPDAPDAPELARLLVRHVSDREAAADAATLRRLGAGLGRLLAAFLARPGLSEADRTAVHAHARATWWDVVRAAARAGRPGLLRLRGAVPALRGGGGAADLAVTLALGMARAGRG